MYVISLVTECDVVEGEKYQVVAESETVRGGIFIIDGIGDEYGLFAGEWEPVKDGGEIGILRERIEALQEDNAELKFRLASLEK